MIARTILSATTGFIREAGFSHSLTPARNCTFGCSYCYVPTMRIYAGLQPEDWKRWGQYTEFKDNAAELLGRELRPDQRIYCSPLVDPYQPWEAARSLMPDILRRVIETPPARFTIQTRGPLILRDLEMLRRIPRLRVSFSVTTDRDDVRRIYEPHCAPIAERWSVIRTLQDAGIEVYATLAPLLPCDPEALAERAIAETGRDLVGDPLHVRAVKRQGATTRDVAFRIADRLGHFEAFDPERQRETIARIAGVAVKHGRRFLVGPEGFAVLSR